jgi:hypothetical protein
VGQFRFLIDFDSVVRADPTSGSAPFDQRPLLTGTLRTVDCSLKRSSFGQDFGPIPMEPSSLPPPPETEAQPQPQSASAAMAMPVPVSPAPVPMRMQVPVDGDQPLSTTGSNPGSRSVTPNSAATPPRESRSRNRDAINNPIPQTAPGAHSAVGHTLDNSIPLSIFPIATDKFCFCFCGLPGRGKTHISRKLARYVLQPIMHTVSLMYE